MEKTEVMPPARWLPRVAAFFLLCAAPFFVAHRAAADDPPAAAPAAAASSPATVPVKVETAAVTTPPAAETAKGAEAAPAPSSGPAAAAPAAKSKPKKPRRGGIHPCMTPDPGFGTYDTWSRAPSMGQMIAPKAGGVRKDGGFDLVVHFHGHEAIRKEFVKTTNGVVLVGIDLGIGSGAYSSGFASPQTFTRLIASVEAEMAKRSGNPKAHVRKLALSSWSAGYGAIEQILRQTGGKNVDAVILLDSLHTGYENEHTKSLKVLQIEPFITFAKRAAAGKAFMFMSHSSIIPPGYASTTEVASLVISQVGGKPAKASRQDVLGLDMIRKYDKGGFHVRGYDGDDKPDHCAHLGLIAGVMKTHLLPRWKTPQTKASAKQPATVKTPSSKKAKDDKSIDPKAKNDKAGDDKVKADKAKDDKSKADKTKTDKAKDDKSKTDKSKTDKAKDDKKGAPSVKTVAANAKKTDKKSPKKK